MLTQARKWMKFCRVAFEFQLSWRWSKKLICGFGTFVESATCWQYPLSETANNKNIDFKNWLQEHWVQKLTTFRRNLCKKYRVALWAWILHSENEFNHFSRFHVCWRTFLERTENKLPWERNEDSGGGRGADEGCLLKATMDLKIQKGNRRRAGTLSWHFGKSDNHRQVFQLQLLKIESHGFLKNYGRFAAGSIGCKKWPEISWKWDVDSLGNRVSAYFDKMTFFSPFTQIHFSGKIIWPLSGFCSFYSFFRFLLILQLEISSLRAEFFTCRFL